MVILYALYKVDKVLTDRNSRSPLFPCYQPPDDNCDDDHKTAYINQDLTAKEKPVWKYTAKAKLLY